VRSSSGARPRRATTRRNDSMDRDAIIGAINGVTKKWAQQRKREERSESSRQRRRAALIPSYEVTFKDAAAEVMERAYLKASNNGEYPAHARQIMYAARNHIQSRTDKPLNDQYFSQTLLPDYLRDHPRLTESWDVVFDARGHFEEPHTELIVP